MADDETIFVTQPFLPPLEEFTPYLESMWETRRLANSGPYHRELESALCEFLGVPYISLFVNGTIALLTALQALRITGEVITTPYSFVATSHSLTWNGIKPTFVDIDPQSFNLDPTAIEAAITPQTTAILPVHCYGRPCDTTAIGEIADNYNLRVVYDGAHAFGVRDSSGSILNSGDLSVLSFHATKVFNTFEGGAIVCSDPKMKRRIDHLKNFGFVDETTVVAPGVNGKMSEFNAALGLLQLKHFSKAITARAHIDARYRQLLSGTTGIRFLEPPVGVQANFAYFPVLVESEYPLSRDDLYEYMKGHGVHPRRYFYPLITEFPMYRGLGSASKDNLPIATQMASKVLCLPIYPGLTDADQDRVIDLITSNAGSAH